MVMMRHAPVYLPLVDLATLKEGHVIQMYHRNRQTIIELCTQLEPDLLPAIHHPYAIPPLVQVLSVLHLFASGSFQMTVGLEAGMSQPMFSNVLKDILCALLGYLPCYIRIPQHADLATVKAAFYDLAHVPYVIEAIGDTNIALVLPRINEQVFRNQKTFYSIDVQVCLADQYIFQVTAKFPGSVHNSCILQNSNVPHMIVKLQRDQAWLIGDSGYPILPWLLRYKTTDGVKHFNEAHSRMRCVIERTFGLLKDRFCCLHISRGALFYKPLKVCRFVVSCCMLHNLALRTLLDVEEVVAVQVVDEGDVVSDEEEDDEDAADSGAELTQQYFLRETVREIKQIS
ncbi:putative nuclease HARBI1 [Pleurodeles waltl]|uniref:putative nuclease HARBI1 n=1 Tax=Pleurodeles waltl TaxID=8319 RepID=UPI003709476C